MGFYWFFSSLFIIELANNYTSKIPQQKAIKHIPTHHNETWIAIFNIFLPQHVLSTTYTMYNIYYVQHILRTTYTSKYTYHVTYTKKYTYYITYNTKYIYNVQHIPRCTLNYYK